MRGLSVGMNTIHDTEVLLSHANWVRALARALVHDAADADDLAQETLQAAWRSGPRESSAWRAWLARVLRNALVKRRRSDARRDARETLSAKSEAAPSVLDDLARLALHREVVAAVEALDEPFRGTVLLRWFDELPPREIARRQRVPVKTVNSRLDRAHAKLRERLRASRGGDERETRRVLGALAGPHVDHPARPGTGEPRAARKLVPAAAAAVVVGLVALGAWTWSRETPAETVAAMLADVDAATTSELSDPGTLEAPHESHRVVARVAVRGRVFDPSGEPVPGATIELRERGSGGLGLPAQALVADDVLAATALSDEAGAWSVTATRDRSYELVVRAAGFARERVEGVAADESLDVRLERAAGLAIMCRDASGTPHAGARVEVRVAGRSRALLAGETDASGAWRTDELPCGTCSVQVRAADGPRTTQFSFAARAGELVERRWDVAAGRVRTGRVVALADKTPIAGAVIESGDGIVCALSSAEGTFRWCEPWNEDYSSGLRVRAAGHACGAIESPRGGDEPYIALLAGRRLSGRVVDEHGDAVPDAWVCAWARWAGANETIADARDTRTDARGAFELADLRPDRPYLLVARCGDRTSGNVVVRAAGADATDVHVNLVVRAGFELTGHVRLASGVPLAGAEVLVERLDGRGGEPAPAARETFTVVVGATDSAQTRDEPVLDDAALRRQRTLTRRDGSWRLVGLVPGRYSVLAKTSAIGFLRREVELPAGTTPAACELVPAEAGAVAGRVLDPDGAPVAAATVLLFRHDDAIESRSLTADERGAFRFEGLEPGRYRVSASHVARVVDGHGDHPLGRTDVHDVECGSVDLEIVLPRNRALMGTVLDVNGRPVRGALVEVKLRDSNAAQAKVTFDGPRVSRGSRDDVFGEQARSDEQGRFCVHVPESATVTVLATWSDEKPPRRRHTAVHAEIAATEDDVVVVEVR